MKNIYLLLLLLFAGMNSFAQQTFSTTYWSPTAVSFNIETNEITPVEGEYFIDLELTLKANDRESIPEFIKGNLLVSIENERAEKEVFISFELVKRMAADVEKGIYIYLGRRKSAGEELHYQIILEGGDNGIERIAFSGDQSKAIIFEDFELVE